MTYRKTAEIIDFYEYKKEDKEEKYMRIDTLVVEAKSCVQKVDRENAILELVEIFTPLIISKSRHFFGKADEDLIADGVLKFIELLEEFDFSKAVPFNGFIKKNMHYFYLNMRKKEKNMNLIGVQRLEFLEYWDRYSNLSNDDVVNAINRLEGLEKEVAKLNILSGFKMSDTANQLGISYSYANKMRQGAIKKLRKWL